MIRSALKKHAPLSLVSTSTPASEARDFAISSYVRKSAYGPVRVNQYSARMTTEDFVNVELATVREGKSHRFWPSDVVLKFIAADVITREQ